MFMKHRIYWISIAGLILCSLGWTWLSFSFDSFRETGAIASTSRPFVLFFLLAILGCAAYLLAIWKAVVQPQTFRVKEILGVAILCRVLLVPSIPIQEIDLYRYLWDGYVVNQGISPYRYAPEEIKQAIAVSNLQDQSDEPPLPGGLARDEHQARKSDRDELTNPEIASLVKLCKQQPEVHRILDIVHFSELPTVYPPVSQAVFAISVYITPENTSRYVRLMVLKSWLMLFDIATILGILVLLKQLSIHQSWAILYSWSPLVLKEYANSGHLDTITVAFSVWAVVILIRAVMACDTSSSNGYLKRSPLYHVLLSAILFACSIAGKLYPIILTPVLLLFLYRRLGIRLAGTWLLASVLASFLFLSAWIFADYGRDQADDHSRQLQSEATAGLQAFMTRWQINDWIFSAVNENLLPDSQRKWGVPWYVITPNSWRESIADSLEKTKGIDSQKNGWPVINSFMVARAITLMLWGLIVVYVLRLLWREPTSQQLVHQIFLVLAWFWLLAPTQNPWYWTWALPFLLPSHRIAWVGMSCVLFAYYVRFPLLYFEANGLVPGTSLSGWALFGDIIVWLEFAPLMLWVLFYKKTNE